MRSSELAAWDRAKLTEAAFMFQSGFLTESAKNPPEQSHDSFDSASDIWLTPVNPDSRQGRLAAANFPTEAVPFPRRSP
jgi:hypothetical protein